MKVATVLKAKTIEEETKTRQFVRTFAAVWLPAYALISIVLYILEVVLVSERTH
jgi:hypothetical protein